MKDFRARSIGGERAGVAAFPSSGDMGMESLGIDPYFFSVVRAWELNSPLVDAMGADTTAADFRLDHRAFEG